MDAVEVEATPAEEACVSPQSDVQTTVLNIQKQLEKTASSPGADVTEVLKLLKGLQDIPVDLNVLVTTRIGMIVNQLRKDSENKEVVKLTKALIKKWKKYLDNQDGNAGPSPSSISSQTTTKSSSDRKTSRNSDSESVATKKPKLECKEERKSSSSSKSSVSFPETLCTTDSVRLKCRELLMNAIRGDGNLPDDTNDPEFLSDKLEEHIFKEYGNPDVKYKNRIRSRVANLKDTRNPNLRLNFLLGEISPMRLAKMTAEEMASDELKATRTRLEQEAINDAQLAVNQGTKTDLLRCGKCRQRDCTYNQLQTRSADEPMTTFVLCNNCGNRWKFC